MENKLYGIKIHIDDVVYNLNILPNPIDMMAYMQGVRVSKDVNSSEPATTINKHCCLFGDVFDLLAYITLYRYGDRMCEGILSADYLIMGPDSSFREAYEILKHYEQVYSFRYINENNRMNDLILADLLEEKFISCRDKLMVDGSLSNYCVRNYTEDRLYGIKIHIADAAYNLNILTNPIDMMAHLQGVRVSKEANSHEPSSTINKHCCVFGNPLDLLAYVTLCQHGDSMCKDILPADHLIMSPNSYYSEAYEILRHYEKVYSFMYVIRRNEVNFILAALLREKFNNYSYKFKEDGSLANYCVRTYNTPELLWTTLKQFWQ